MMKSVNIEEKLVHARQKSLHSENILSWVSQVFNEIDVERNKTLQKLKNNSTSITNKFDIDKVEANKIYHISQIKKVCVDYRLRFLETKFFKGDYPAEAITKIKELERKHNIKLNGFKIIAPSVLFRLKKADDPILLAPMGNDYYYLIHKWGNDLHPLRKLLFWPIKNVGNLLFSFLLLSIGLTVLTNNFIFNNQVSLPYTIMLFMFYFKGVVGLTLFYGIALGKNFNENIWQSKYDKVC
ncbi:hypothetical protein [Tenacibaculum geojense]|uniref:Uncharacterized protein n=1 Tax=Tenacibaculum geojense TaxID=915352 RepID=A0ABW3JRD6_9FLAO